MMIVLQLEEHIAAKWINKTQENLIQRLHFIVMYQSTLLSLHSSLPHKCPKCHQKTLATPAMTTTTRIPLNHTEIELIALIVSAKDLMQNKINIKGRMV